MQGCHRSGLNFGASVLFVGEVVKPEDRSIYWYYIYKAASTAICSETVELGALIDTQGRMDFGILGQDVETEV